MSRGRLRTALVVALLTLEVLLAPPAARATEIGPVTLAGLLDLVGTDHGRATRMNALNMGGSSFDSYRLRLFADAVPDEKLSVFTQTIWGDEAPIEVVGAYVDYAPWPGRDLHVQAGKIPWWVGTYAPRTYSNRNTLIGTPLLYQYHTTFPYNHLPPNADALLAQAGNGQFGVTYSSAYRPAKGLPILYDACWDFGVVAVGSLRPLEFAIGGVNGAPSSAQPGRDNNNGKSVLGRIGASPYPGLRFGVSGSYGPYLAEALELGLPAGTKVGDYAQRLWVADLAWAIEHLEIYSEGFTNRWETPTVGNLDCHGVYVEAKYAFPVGAYVAARFDEIRFSDLADSTGLAYPWDANVRRLEAGAGFRFTRSILAKAVYQWNRTDPRRGDAAIREADTGAVQLSVGF